MRYLMGFILSIAVISYAGEDDLRNGTGFFVNGAYIVTAYHVVSNFEHACYYDIKNDTCYQVRVVDYEPEPDLALLKLVDVPVEPPSVCRLAHVELPIGEPMMSYGYLEPFLEPWLTTIPVTIRMQYSYGGDYRAYRMTGVLKRGMSGGPNVTRDGRIGGLSKSISLVEENTSNLVKSTEVVRMLKKNGVREYFNSNTGEKCAVSIVNTVYLFRSAKLTWGDDF